MIARGVGWVLAAAVVTGRVVQAVRSRVYGDDLRVFWTAGHHAVAGLDPWVRGFDYLPAGLGLYAPLGLLPFDVARTAWLVVGVAAVVGTAAWVARQVALPAPLVVGAVFLAYPTESALQFANATVLELPLLAALVAAVRADRWWRAAAVAAVAVAIKPLLLPCLLVFLLRRRVRELAAVVLALAATSGVALLVVGRPRAYVDELRSSLHVAGSDPASADLGAFADRHELPIGLLVATGLVVLVVVVLALVRNRDPAVQVTVPLLASFLVGPVCWMHYPLVLLPLVASRGRMVAVACWLLLVVPEVVHGGLLHAVPPAPLFGLVTAALLVLLAACVRRPARGRAAT